MIRAWQGQGVTFRNGPAFAAHLDAASGPGRSRLGRHGPCHRLKPEPGREIARVSVPIRQAVIEQLPVAHPDYPGVGITISQLSGPTEDPAADGKNAVTMATGELPLDRPCRHQSILGNIHTGRLVDKTMLAGRPAVLPESPASAGSMG